MSIGVTLRPSAKVLKATSNYSYSVSLSIYFLCSIRANLTRHSYDFFNIRRADSVSPMIAPVNPGDTALLIFANN